MGKLNYAYFLPLGLSLLAGCAGSNGGERNRSFSEDWKFIREDVTGAESLGFDDSAWMTVDLPHDFSLIPLAGGDTEDQIGPFSKQSPGVNATGHVMGGTGWYRKTFTVDPADAGKSFTLEFGGAYMETDVWVNGKKIGDNKHGYTPFAFDITAALNPAGEENVVAVRVDNQGRNSRWYSGSGLYRDVKLVVTDPVHVDTWGAYITTPMVSQASANVRVQVSVRNDAASIASANVKIRLVNQSGEVAPTVEVPVEIGAKDKALVAASLVVEHPALWSVDAPNLYAAEISVEQGDKVVDVYTQRFGIRSIEITAEKGLLLNGEPLLLKGGCLHHDNGFLGAAAIRRAEYRRVQLMKDNGYNAIRCSHNPPSEYFLDACDEIGIVVIDEFTDQWNLYKSPNDYARFFNERWEADLTNMITRDRNHPSIILWSIGNEIPKDSFEEGVAIGEKLKAKVNALDGTRMVTEAVTNMLIPGGMDNSYHTFGVLDVCGYNYGDHFFEPHHELYPDRIMYGSETFPNKIYDGWKQVEEKPYVIGDFVWTAMDYIGEVAVGYAKYVKEKRYMNWQNMNGLPAGLSASKFFDFVNSYSTSAWPNYVSWCGDLDIIGEKKPQGRYRDVVWDEKVVEMNVHEPIPDGMEEEMSFWGWPLEYASWNWEGNEGKPLQVRVFTKAPQVRLELNGETVGEKSLVESDQYIASFDVPYQPGTLTAIALKDGKELGRQTLMTTGKAVAIQLTVDRPEIQADRSDLAFIRIDAVDENGQTVNVNDVTVNIAVDGDGELVASGSSNQSDMKSVNRPNVTLYRGQAQAIVRPFTEAGTIDVTVTANGFDGAKARIVVR